MGMKCDNSVVLLQVDLRPTRIDPTIVLKELLTLHKTSIMLISGRGLKLRCTCIYQTQVFRYSSIYTCNFICERNHIRFPLAVDRF